MLHEQLYPYHVQKVQSLLSEDFPHQVTVVPVFYSKISWPYRFRKNVTYKRGEILANQNLKTYTVGTFEQKRNPHAIMKNRHQYQLSSNAWVGVPGDYLFFCFLPQTLNYVSSMGLRSFGRSMEVLKECSNPRGSALVHKRWVPLWTISPVLKIYLLSHSSICITVVFC